MPSDPQTLCLMLPWAPRLPLCHIYGLLGDVGMALGTSKVPVVPASSPAPLASSNPLLFGASLHSLEELLSRAGCGGQSCWLTLSHFLAIELLRHKQASASKPAPGAGNTQLALQTLRDGCCTCSAASYGQPQPSFPPQGYSKWDPVVARAVFKAGRAVHGVPGTKRR